MAPVGLAHGAAQIGARLLGVAGRLEIGNQEDYRAPMQDVIGDIERLDAVGAAALRRVVQNVAHHAQHVAAAFPRRQVALDAIGVEQQSDLVAVADRGEGEDARELGREIALAHGGRAEIARSADVDQQ